MSKKRKRKTRRSAKRRPKSQRAGTTSGALDKPREPVLSPQDTVVDGVDIQEIVDGIRDAGDFLSPEGVDKLDTEELIATLQYFGVPFEEAEFLRDLHELASGERVSERWRERYTIDLEATDTGFLWMAAVALARRFAPEQVTCEKIDGLMQEGYDHFEVDSATCSDIWLEVWEMVKELVPHDIKRIREADNVFSGMQALFNWCQDLEQELGNAAESQGVDRGGRDYWRERIRYCEEFVERFPATSEDLMVNFWRAIAESYFAIGEPEKGERAFERMARDYPKNVWSYVARGDMYAHVFRRPGLPPKDLAKARRLYEQALENSGPRAFDRDVARQRLRDLGEL